MVRTRRSSVRGARMRVAAEKAGKVGSVRVRWGSGGSRRRRGRVGAVGAAVRTMDLLAWRVKERVARALEKDGATSKLLAGVRRSSSLASDAEMGDALALDEEEEDPRSGSVAEVW